MLGKKTTALAKCCGFLNRALSIFDQQCPNMNWLLIVNDDNCKKELDLFLKKNGQSVLMKETVEKTISELKRTVISLREVLGLARISINSANTVNVIRVNDIVHCESQRSYTCLHLSNGSKITATKTLKQFEKELEGYSFLRIHQSHLISLQYVEKFVKSKTGQVVMTDGTRLPVATRKREMLFKELELL